MSVTSRGYGVSPSAIVMAGYGDHGAVSTSGELRGRVLVEPALKFRQRAPGLRVGRVIVTSVTLRHR